MFVKEGYLGVNSVSIIYYNHDMLTKEMTLSESIYESSSNFASNIKGV